MDLYRTYSNWYGSYFRCIAEVVVVIVKRVNNVAKVQLFAKFGVMSRRIRCEILF